MAPGEICILIYLSYILYISKFFIPLQWLHASFMRSSVVFAGQIQTHFTRQAAAAARLFHLGCVGWMKNWLSGVVKKFFFSPHTTKFFWCRESPPHRLFFFPPPTFSLTLLLLLRVELWKLQEKHPSDLENLFCWGWVTDTIRWIWKWCVNATHGASRG